jgi:heme exporter protein C
VSTTKAPAPATTSSSGTRTLGLLALAGAVALAVLGLAVSPRDAVQGDPTRLMYVHVPAAIGAYVAFAVTAVGSVSWLWKRSRWWDWVAAASAEVGTLLTGLTLATGMLWGRPIWGAFWVWDARLTSTALLFLMFCGYLAVRRLPADVDARNRRCAFVALLAFVDVPVVHYSVDWWDTLHQDATVTRLDPQIDGLMLFTLFVGIAVYLVGYLWLLVHRFRVAYLEDQVATRSLDVAIAERRAEGALSR